MTSPDTEETRDVDIKGRDITVLELIDAQLLLLAREDRLAQKPDTDGARRLAAVGRIFDLLESVVVKEEDREYLLDLVVKRNLTLGDLTGFISAFQSDEDEQPKARVRRGRPPAKRT
ncbi:MAG TPA: hypothetical protein VK899_02335 [Gemmatimonadales bacterium]|nr:hypothetical protein [Gemmatimonadales bacterium]